MINISDLTIQQIKVRKELLNTHVWSDRDVHEFEH